MDKVILIVGVLTAAVSISDALYCYQCNNLDHQGCEADFQSIMLPRTCDVPDPACYSAQTKDGYMERGCMTRYNSTSHKKTKCHLKQWGDTCDTCYIDGCNGKLPDPFQCYNCTSDRDPTCASWPTKSIKCNHYDFCQTYMKKGEVIRGCAPIWDPSCNRTPGQIPAHCRICFESLCNMKPVTPTPSLECYDCVSNETSGCGYDFNTNAINTVQCHKTVELYPICVTATMKDSQVVKRFCASTFDFPCSDSNFDSCKTCNEKLCNAPKYEKKLKCLCKSLDVRYCDQWANTSGSIQCDNVFDDPACFNATWNGHVLRGCTSMADSNRLCKSDYEKCAVCNLENCNTRQTNGGNTPSGLMWNLSLVLPTIYVYTRNL